MKNNIWKILIIVVLIAVVALCLINRNIGEGYAATTSSIFKTAVKTDNGHVQLTGDLSLTICENGDEYRMPLPPLINASSLLDAYGFFYSDGYVYYSFINSYDGSYMFYRYNLESRHTEEIGALKLDSSRGEELVLYTANNDSILLLVGNTIYYMDIVTGIVSKGETLKEHYGSIAVLDGSIIYSDKNGHVLTYNIKKGEEKELAGIESILYAVYDDKLYFADMKNDGGLSTYSFTTQEIEHIDKKMVIGFGMGKDGIEPMLLS